MEGRSGGDRTVPPGKPPGVDRNEGSDARAGRTGAAGSAGDEGDGGAAISPEPGIELPSRLAQGWVVARGQIRHYVRTQRFVGLVLFVAVVAGLWLALLLASDRGVVQLTYLNSISEFLTDYAGTVPLWIVLAAAFFGGDALSVDFHSGTGYYTLVLPVERGVLLAGRYLSALSVTLTILVAYDVFGLLGATYVFGADAIPWHSVGASFGLSVLFALAAVSVAFCFSALFETPAAGVLLTILVLFVAMTTIDGVAQLAGVAPVWSFSFAGGSIANVLDWQFVAHQMIPVGNGQYTNAWAATGEEGAAIMAAYFLVFFGASIAIYRRKESRG